MADERHIIDIILRARDDTARALASATSNIQAFEKVTEDGNRQNENFKKSFAELSREISTSQEKIKSITRDMNMNEKAVRSSAAAQSELQRAVQAQTKTLNDQNSTRSQQAAAVLAVEAAEQKLNKTLKEGTKLSAERRQQIVQEIKTEAERIASAQQLRQVQVEGARAIAEAEREAARERSELIRTLETAERDSYARRKQWADEAVAEDAQRRKREDQAAKESAALQAQLLRQEQEQADDAERRRQERFEARQDQLEREAQAEQDLAEVRAQLAKQEADQAAQTEAERVASFEARQDQLDREAQAERDLAEVRSQLRKQEQEQAAQEEADRIANFEARQAQLERQRQAEEDAARERAELNRVLNRSEQEAERRRIANANAENREIQQTIRAREKAAAARERQMARELSLGRQYVQQIQMIQSIEQRQRRADDVGDFTTRAQLDFDASDARAKAAALAAELKALFANIEANIDLDDAAAQAHAAEVLAMKQILERDIKIDVDIDVDAADVARVNALADGVDRTGRNSDDAGRRMGFLSGMLGALRSGFDSSSTRIASFDNFLRGLLSLGIALFFNQLILLAGAAAGGLIALASSAAMAGAAIGGALSAGIAQAIPVLGIFGAALARAKGVMEAVQQANLLQQQQSYQGAQQARQHAGALDAVVGAEDRLADAHRRIADAQEGVNDARDAARRKLEELIFAERGLNLSLEENERAIRRAAASGQTGALPRLFLRRDETERQLTTTNTEITKRQDSGIEGSPEVKAAQEALKDAERSAKDAGRALDSAKRSAQDAAAGTTAAAGKLAFLLGQMSAAERRMYEAVIRLQEVWRGFSRNVSAPLIDSFTRAINRVIALLQDNAVIKAARDLSGEMAKSFDRIFDSFTSNRAIAQLLRITDQARKNLAPLTDIAVAIGRAFFDIAEAAGPALRDIILWVRDITVGIGDFFEKGRKSGDLTRFFEQGVTHLKAWGDLVWQVIRLFAALAGPGGGAHTGLQLVRDMGDAIRGWADAISDPESKLNQFFQRFFRLSRQMIEAMSPVFQSIANEINKTFTKDGVSAVEGFAHFLSAILIPAIGDFARWLGAAVVRVSDFVKEHPQIAKFASAFIATTLAVTTLSKAFTIFGPITSVLSFLGRQILVATGAMRGLAAGGRVAGAMFTWLRPLLLGPWGLLAAGVTLILAKLGLLDDLMRAVGGFFVAIWEQVRPPIDRAVDSFKKLFDAVGKGQGAFAALRPILKIVIDILGFFLEGIGRSIGKVLGGAIDIISGFIEILVGLLTGDFGAAWEGLKRIVTGAGRAIIGLIELFLLRGMGKLFTSIIRGAISFGKSLGKWLLEAGRDGAVMLMRFLLRLPGRIVALLRNLIAAARDGIPGLISLFGRIGSRVFEVVRSGFGRVLDFFKNLPGRLFEFVKGVPGKLADAFKGVGGKILAAMFAGITNVAGVGKDIINGLIDLLNYALPDEIPTPGPNIPLPDNPIERLAQGGPIGAGYGGGDRRLILAEDGEHMLTKEEVRSAGGHGVIFALRALLGGGGQAKGGAFAEGGAITGGGNISVGFSGNLGDFTTAWREMWTDAVAIGRRGATAVRATFNMMRGQLVSIMERLFRDVRGRWADIEESGINRSRRLVRGITRSFNELQEVVYDGMRYVGNTTNKALESFDADPIKLSLARPGATRKAVGGVMGQWGERGRDAIHALIGKGEVVLNWGQQAALNARLVGQDTVQSIVTRSQGLHAGTYGEALGFAGGYAGQIPGNGVSVGIPGAPGEFIAKRIVGQVVQMMRRFKMAATDGFATSGHAPGGDHPKGLAVDFVPGSGGNWDLVDKAASYARSKLGDVFRWIGYDGVAGHGRGHHLHLSWLSDAAGLGQSAIETIAKIAVRGNGALQNLGQKSINKVRQAANKILEGQMDSGFMSAHPTGEGVLSSGEVRSVIKDAMDAVKVPDQLRSAWMAMAYDRARQESGFNPSIQNNWDINAKNGDPSRGLFQTIGATFRDYMQPGHGNILNPLDNAIAAFRYMNSNYGGGDWSRALVAMNARRGIGYDSGGAIGGPEGSPQFILAHAGEWVLNRLQQSKLAQMMGLGVGKLRDQLGFTGGPSSFAGGGDVRTGRATEGGRYIPPAVDPTSLAAITREIDTVYQAIQNISKKGKLGQQIDRFMKGIRNLTDQDGGLDQMGTAIERLGTRLARNLDLAQVGLRRVGNRLVQRTRGPLVDAVEIAELTVANLDRVRDALRDEREVAERGLRQTDSRLAAIRKGGVSKKEQDRYQALMGARQKFLDTLDDIDGKIAENRAARFEARVEQFNANTERDLKGSQNTQRIGELGMRIASALGNIGNVDKASQYILLSLQQQQQVLQARLRAAQAKARSDPRWQAVADALQKQLDDVTGSITEQIVERFNTAVETLDRSLSRTRGRQDITERLLSVQERAGNRLGAAQGRVSLSDQRAETLRREQMFIQSLISRAAAEGNQRAVEDLTDRLVEVNAAIVEEAQTRRELILAYRTTATDIISGREERTTGLIGTASAIIQSVGELTGYVDIDKLAQLIQQALDQLAISAGEIAANVRDAADEFSPEGNSVLAQLATAFQSGPESFASKLAQLAPLIAALEAGMGDAEREAFQALIQSMIENTTAVVDNTKQLEDIVSPPTGQSFSTTLWTMFRNAVFNGNGSVLPKYDVPQMHVGGYVTRGGIFDLEVGERVLTPGQQGGTSGEHHEHIHITNPTEVADPDYIFEVAEFKRSTRRAT